VDRIAGGILAKPPHHLFRSRGGPRTMSPWLVARSS
jgi:hypothetical protein